MKEKVRMSYNTYAWLSDCINNRIHQLENEYRIAMTYVPTDATGQRSRDHAWAIFREERDKMERMKDELRASVQDSYRDHPDAEMRAFWNIKD